MTLLVRRGQGRTLNFCCKDSWELSECLSPDVSTELFLNYRNNIFLNKSNSTVVF